MIKTCGKGKHAYGKQRFKNAHRINYFDLNIQ